MKVKPSDRYVLSASEFNTHDFPFVLSLCVDGVGTTFIGYGSDKVAVRDAKLFKNICGLRCIEVYEVLNNIRIWKSW